MIRACLLHDVGRTAKDICLMDKVTSVLLGKFLPQKSKQWANRAEKLKLNKEKSFWQKEDMLCIFITIMHNLALKN